MPFHRGRPPLIVPSPALIQAWIVASDVSLRFTIRTPVVTLTVDVGSPPLSSMFRPPAPTDSVQPLRSIVHPAVRMSTPSTGWF